MARALSPVKTSRENSKAVDQQGTDASCVSGKASGEHLLCLVPTLSRNGHGNECPTLGGLSGQNRTQDSDQTLMVEPQSARAVTEEVLDEPVPVVGHVVPEGNCCFQLLALCRMPAPPTTQAMNDTDDNDRRWAFMVAAAIQVGVIRIGMRLGFWTMGDMRSDFILMLLEDYSSDVEELCSMYHWHLILAKNQLLNLPRHWLPWKVLMRKA